MGGGAMGGVPGGWSLYVKDGKLDYVFNDFGSPCTTIAASQPLPKGKVKAVVDFVATPADLARSEYHALDERPGSRQDPYRTHGRLPRSPSTRPSMSVRTSDHPWVTTRRAALRGHLEKVSLDLSEA